MNIPVTKAGKHAGEIADAIAAATGLKLKADSPADIVNGYVSVAGDKVEVVFYDADEAAGAGHKTTFKRPASMPSAAAIRAIVEAL